jgi:hypothetical protein
MMAHKPGFTFQSSDEKSEGFPLQSLAQTLQITMVAILDQLLFCVIFWQSILFLVNLRLFSA